MLPNTPLNTLITLFNTYLNILKTSIFAHDIFLFVMYFEALLINITVFWDVTSLYMYECVLSFNSASWYIYTFQRDAQCSCTDCLLILSATTLCNSLECIYIAKNDTRSSNVKFGLMYRYSIIVTWLCDAIRLTTESNYLPLQY